MEDTFLMDGSIVVMPRILNFTFGKLNRREEVITVILTVRFMLTEWSLQIIKIPTTGGFIQGNYPLAAGQS